MKVSTRLALGSGVLIALLATVTSYGLVRLQRLGRATRDLAAADFRGATGSLELGRSADLLEEAVRKLFVLHDRGYAELVVEARGRVDVALDGLSRLPLPPPVAVDIDDAARAWREFPLVEPETDQVLAKSLQEGGEDALERSLDVIGRIRAAAAAALQDGQQEITRKVTASSAAVVEAERVAATILAASLVAAVIVVVLTVRSIVLPLRRLVSGTRAVGQGSFGVRLDERGGDELAALAAEFNHMVERLDELDALKRQFVSHVSHELKTPLVAMRETTSLLLDGQSGPLTDGQRRMLELNLEAANRLSRMISDLLDVSRMEAGAVEYELRPWPLDEIVAAAVGELQVWAVERGVMLEPSVARVLVEGDRDRLVQVLLNLLDNATRHSERGGRVEVLVGEPEERGSDARVVVRVVDHGVGVAEADRESLFARFRQGGGGRRGGGVGLGLAICREIVAAHGGTIEVSDTPGGGATFSFDLAVAGSGG